MRLPLRLLSSLLVIGVVLACGACASKHEQIAGKWKVVTMPGVSEKEMKALTDAGGYYYFSFATDRTVTVAIVLPQTQERVVRKGTYELPKGKQIDFSWLESDQTETPDGTREGEKQSRSIRFDRDNMTIIGPYGDTKLARMD